MQFRNLKQNISTLKGLLLIIDFSVPRDIFPERVFGSFLITTACLKHAIGPMLERTWSTTWSIKSLSEITESFQTCFVVVEIRIWQNHFWEFFVIVKLPLVFIRNPNGTTPLILSLNSTTAHSDKSSWFRIALTKRKH